MRQETMKALEVRVNSVMAERRKSHMQTLGAKNDFGSNNVLRNQRNSTASIPLKEVFENGQINRAYEDDEVASRNSLSLPKHNRNNGNWKSNNSRM